LECGGSPPLSRSQRATQPRQRQQCSRSPSLSNAILPNASWVFLACHPGRSGQAFSSARFPALGLRSGGTRCKNPPHQDRPFMECGGSPPLSQSKPNRKSNYAIGQPRPHSLAPDSFLTSLPFSFIMPTISWGSPARSRFSPPALRPIARFPRVSARRSERLRAKGSFNE
jgi:hypothetical protein